MNESPAGLDEVFCELILADASDGALIQALTPHIRPGETVERLITELLRQDHRLPGEVRVRAQVRWYRRAMDAGHLWALYEAGSLWSSGGSHDSLGHPRQGEPGDEDTVSADEARNWVIRAAEQGHRRACLEAAHWNPEDARADGWLRTFYGNGVFDDELDRVERATAALWLARLLDTAGNPEAGDWYRIAAMCPPWTDFDAYQSSWVEAAAGYALWSHSQGDPDLCGAWAFRVLENAANQGPGDRGYLATEWKIYRDDWQVTAGKEAARTHVMWHLLAEHDLPEWQKAEIALLLTNSWRFDQSDSEKIQAALGNQTIQSLTLSQLLPAITAQRIQGLEVPINAKHAWAAVHWLLADAVPAAFRFAGLEEEAADFQELVPDDIKGTTRWQWMIAAESFEGWQRLYQADRERDSSQPWEYWLAEAASFRKIASEWVRDLTERVGLGERQNLFQTARPTDGEDWLEVDLHEIRWRFLRGRRAWLGMYCATANAGDADEWIGWWDDASKLVVYALQGAFGNLGHRLRVSWFAGDAIPDEIHEQWKVLEDAYELAFTTFVDQAAALK